METKTFLIPNINCGHCVMTIKTELKDIEGVKKVEETPGTKLITVEWDAPATLDKIRSTLTDINFPAAD